MSNESAFEILDDLIAAFEMPRYGTPDYIAPRQHRPESLESIGAGDCEKHGRWYGICHSCRKDLKAAERDCNHELQMARERAMEVCIDRAKKLLLSRAESVELMEES